MAETKKPAEAKEKKPTKAAAVKKPAKKTTAAKTTSKTAKDSPATKAPATKAPAAKKARVKIEATPSKAEKKEIVSKAKEEKIKETKVAAKAETSEKAVKLDKDVKKPKKVEKVELEEFNWETVGKTGELYSEKDRLDMETMYNNTLTSIKVQDVVDGEVVSITGKEVIVNIGYKSDGVISLSELRYNKDLKIGGNVEVFIESQEDKNGQLVLSHTKARALRA